MLVHYQCSACGVEVRRWAEGEPFDMKVRPWPESDAATSPCPHCKKILMVKCMTEHGYAIRLLGLYASGQLFSRGGGSGPGVVWVGADEDYEVFDNYAEAEDLRVNLVKLGLLQPEAEIVELGKHGPAMPVLDREVWSGRLLPDGTVEIRGTLGLGIPPSLPAPGGRVYLPCKCGVIVVTEWSTSVICPSCARRPRKSRAKVEPEPETCGDCGDEGWVCGGDWGCNLKANEAGTEHDHKTPCPSAVSCGCPAGEEWVG
jgi:hypothetical protein